jgi:chromate transporter
MSDSVPAAAAHQDAPARGGVLGVFLVALRLGLTSFGGPIAHVGYFRDEYVARRRWLGEAQFGELVALSQVLPGPASSQLGVAVGMVRAGPAGGLAAWVGFTLPSAVAMIAFAALVGGVDTTGAGWVAGLQAVAVAVVAQAVWSMGRRLIPDATRAAIAIAATALLLVADEAAMQVVAIGLGALAGWAFVRPAVAGGVPTRAAPRIVGRRLALGALVAFALLLAGLPLANRATDSHAVAMSDAYYRSGALVFGGGHVVLPLLEERVVPPGWVSQDDFLAGYGAAQALPGPLFTFAGYLGAVQGPEPDGIPGGVLALSALFLPALLLVVGAFPFWEALRRRRGALGALAGVNAAVVGVLLAALYDPVGTAGLTGPGEVAVAAASFALLSILRLPPVVVVAAAALAGAVLL